VELWLDRPSAESNSLDDLRERVIANGLPSNQFRVTKQESAPIRRHILHTEMLLDEFPAASGDLPGVIVIDAKEIE